MQIHQIKRTTKQISGKRIGRGGKRGTTSGRGTKGQMARAGHKLYPELRDAIKKLPKLRGYRFKSIQPKLAPVNLREIETVFAAGEAVTPLSLIEHKLIEKRGGVIPGVKILSTGTVSKKLSFEGVSLSASAREKIEAAGGTIK